jgi:glycogen(starch) synthase
MGYTLSIGGLFCDILMARMKSVEESVCQLTDQMFDFCQKSRRQRINQRNRTERLSDLLDWKRIGLEYIKARFVALRRKWPDLINQVDAFNIDDEDGLERGYESSSPTTMADRDDFSKLGYKVKVPKPASVPGSVADEDEERESFDNHEDVYENQLRRTNSTLLLDLKKLALDGESRNTTPVSGVPSVLEI